MDATDNVPVKKVKHLIIEYYWIVYISILFRLYFVIGTKKCKKKGKTYIHNM